MGQITTIDLLRHGACEGGEIFRGSTDVVLTEQGWQQMGAALAGEAGWQRVISSPLRRCRLFAEQWASEQGLPLQVCDELREISFGDWEGRFYAEIEREQGELLQAFWAEPLKVTPPNGEPMLRFRARVLPAINALLDAHVGEHLLLVVHGAVIRLLICEWLSMAMTAFSNIAVPYGALSRIRIYHRVGRPPWLQLCFHRGEAPPA
jgi:broad specificity phosphatase PhoE